MLDGERAVGPLPAFVPPLSSSGPTMRPIPLLPVRLAAAALVALAAACTPAATGSGPVPRGESLEALYRAAIHDAAVYREEHVRKLNAAVPVNDSVRVATFTSTAYPLGTNTVTDYVWTTLTPEVQDSCRTFPGDPKLRIEQLLGLPPVTDDSLMVEFQVAVADLFRPAGDPTITTDYPCGDTLQHRCGDSFPDSVSPAHVRWIADQTFELWRQDGYPWTRLGYTYNWHPGSPRYGASEYVIRQGATVNVLSVTPYQAYCAAA
jgi:hypothetical protein